ncbi:CRP/FNR family transcriptional regulator, anaerobic regulatory protein [Thermoflavifilum thermophilum]|uniref:CRP/FNR family transcriptional regulator, anaerobic regulatory protein n=2 Tax=Thermoflavifilum thermophilum TaxID=1393122 RepID=A0A1I7NCU3_9BACT|nr:CRP/FNR family transcriptional regulator, anaerobic regulatory protein [Thermoflavifilum thermophilum]
MKDELLEKWMDAGDIRTFPAGAVLLQDGSYIRSVPVVLSGVVKVLKQNEEGREILLYYIQPGESCVMSFLGGLHEEKSKIKAVVEEDADVLLIPIDEVRRLIREEYGFVEFMFRLYHRRFEEVLSVLEAVAFKRMDERLLSLLHKKVLLNGSPQLQITHQQLADELGTDRVVVSRLLKQLENEGIVQLGRNRIVVLKTSQQQPSV